jgi:hypothetical protein
MFEPELVGVEVEDSNCSTASFTHSGGMFKTVRVVVAADCASTLNISVFPALKRNTNANINKPETAAAMVILPAVCA